MCTSPIHIKNNSTYKNIFHSFEGYDVPCGNCEDCRNSRKSDWQTRISFEVSSLYSRGGCAVFLTFTYNNAHIPMYRDGDFCVECFNRADVLAFLNRVKVASYRVFGPSAYKYFFTSEYGKNTKRPHYHGLFFLQPGVDFQQFTEICRYEWKVGYMFPKYDEYTNMYVDSKGSGCSPLIKSLAGGAKYVSKYVTKDLSFYGIPELAEYLKDEENKKKMTPFLPKHWQSNLLGLTVLDQINLFDKQSVEQLLNVGVVNPLTFKVVPCPKFIIDKLLYKNVKSDRISSKTGKPLYDRYLSDFGRQYMRSVFNHRVEKFSSKMSEVYQLAIADPCRYDLQQFDFTKLPNIGVLDCTKAEQFRPLAVFHLFWNMSSVFMLKKFLKDSNGAVIDLFDTDKVFPYWLKAKDCEYLKKHSCTYGLDFNRVCKFVDKSLYYNLFSDYEAFHTVFCQVSAQIANERNEKMRKDFEELERIKREFKCRFDTTLC